MVSKWKKGMALLAALLMLGSLAGCGDGKTPSSGTSGGDGSSPSGSGDVADYQQNEFRIMAWWDSTPAAGSEIEKLNNEMIKQYNISKLTWVSVPLDEYMSRLTSDIAAGTPADVCWATVDNLVALVRNDSLACLDDFDMSQSKVFIPQYADALKIDGKKYAMVSDTYPEGILYNKTLIRDAGLDDPWQLYESGEWTWDNFYNIAKSLTDASKQQFGLLGGYSFANTYCQISGFLYTNGSTPVKDEDGKKVFAMDDPSQMEALQFIQKLYTGTTAVVDTENIYDHAPDIFKEGKTVFAVSTGYTVEQLKKEALAFDYALVPYPKGPQAETNVSPMRGISGVVCPKNTRSPETALKVFEEFVLNEKRPSYMDLDGNLDEEAWETNFTRGQLYFSDSQLARMCQTDEEIDNIIKVIDTQTQAWEGSYGLTDLMTELLKVVVEGSETPASAVQSRKGRAQEIIDLTLGQ